MQVSVFTVFFIGTRSSFEIAKRIHHFYCRVADTGLRRARF